MPDADAPQVEPKTLTPPWAYYRRTGLSEMRPYVPGEDLTGISVSDPDKGLLAAAAESGENPGGYIARNPRNHADQWYVAQAYFDANFELVDVPVVARDDTADLTTAYMVGFEKGKDAARDDTAELAEALRAWQEWAAKHQASLYLSPLSEEAYEELGRLVTGSSAVLARVKEQR